MKPQKYKNRYGDEYTFTPTEDGNILWEGSFEYCRMGFPNDYTKAYSRYVQDGGELELGKFIDELHADQPNELSQKYRLVVESSHDKINMIDPSGGPFISTGMKSEHIHPDVKEKIVTGFRPIENGYIIELIDKQ